jgi:hypothetical protein
MTDRIPSPPSPASSNRLEARSNSTDPAWSAPLWLDSWHFTDPVPAARHDVERAILATERALEPVPPEAILEGIKRLLDAVNPPSQSGKRDEIATDLAAWWKRNHEIYVAALADLPADLLKAGSVAALRHCRFMPKPADIRRPVEDELARRQSALTRLRTAARKAAREGTAVPVKREQLTAEQEARLARLLGRPLPQPPAGEAA